MKKAFTKDSKEKEMFGAFWELCQKYWIPEESSEYWKELTHDVDEFVGKYKNLHPVVMELASGLVGGLDMKMREDKNG